MELKGRLFSRLVLLPIFQSGGMGREHAEEVDDPVLSRDSTLPWTVSALLFLCERTDVYMWTMCSTGRSSVMT